MHKVFVHRDVEFKERDLGGQQKMARAQSLEFKEPVGAQEDHEKKK